MTPPKHFGTDGIRGLVGEPPISVDFILKVGFAVGKLIASNKQQGKVIIGKDTRISGYMIVSALEAGLSAAGVDIHLLGVIPTPAIAYLTRALRADMGITISASHNPYYDNGIKFFNDEGLKLSNEQELTIETLVDQPIVMSTKKRLGKAYLVKDAQGRYIEFCKGSVPHHTNLESLKIIVDCANGATYAIAPCVFRELGADVIEIHNKPNGTNINDNSGACHPKTLRDHVLQEKADLGIAFDGDGDRVIMVDEKGEIVDGDEILYAIILGLLEAKSFSGGVVGTVMSNQGLEVAVKNLGINFMRTKVGDQHIVEQLVKRNWILGGEASGHIIYRTINTSGDGIVSALQVLQAMFLTGKTLHELKQGMKKFPQQIINLSYSDGKVSLETPAIIKLIKDCEEKLQPHGRVLLRYSGTEPVLRIMTEGEDEALVKETAQMLSDTLSGLFDH